MKFGYFASIVALSLISFSAKAQDTLRHAAIDSVKVAADSVAVVAPAVVADTVAVDSVAKVAPVPVDSVAVVADTAAVAVAPEPFVPFLLANELQSPMVNFEGVGGTQTVKVKSSTGWWYLEGAISWCEIKNVTDSCFTLRCNVNSAPLARHSYVRVKTEGVEDATVAVVQASLPDNFLSVGAWRDSLKNRRSFEYGGCSLMVSEDEMGFEDCPFGWFYVGSVRHGRKTGHGCCYDRYGNLIYSGDFYKDIPAGEFPSRDSYSNYKFECQKFSNGTVYFGETRKGLRHGYGIFMSADGSLWFGRWNNGQQIASEGVPVVITATASDSDL